MRYRVVTWVWYACGMGILSVVATPIGNLEDMTLRALRVLGEADVVACEDTRTTKKLLNHYSLTTPTVSFHAHSGVAKVEKILDYLRQGKHVALVTDAGTPGVSDPGSVLVSAAREQVEGVRIEAIPGASALSAALSVSGLSGSEFLFLGFLPHKKGRETRFAEIAQSSRAVVFYESPHRILKTLTSLAQHCPHRRVILARELTKLHETVLIGESAKLLEVMQADTNQQKGEFVGIVV